LTQAGHGTCRRQT